jgi:hypothetical protein
MTVDEIFAMDQFEDRWDNVGGAGQWEIADLLQRFLDEQLEKDTELKDKLVHFLEKEAGLVCERCGGQMDTCCSSGKPRCPDCDGPCPACNDGPGPGEDWGEDTDELDFPRLDLDEIKDIIR